MDPAAGGADARRACRLHQHPLLPLAAERRALHADQVRRRAGGRPRGATARGGGGAFVGARRAAAAQHPPRRADGRVRRYCCEGRFLTRSRRSRQRTSGVPAPSAVVHAQRRVPPLRQPAAAAGRLARREGGAAHPEHQELVLDRQAAGVAASPLFLRRVERTGAASRSRCGGIASCHGRGRGASSGGGARVADGSSCRARLESAHTRGKCRQGACLASADVLVSASSDTSFTCERYNT